VSHAAEVAVAPDAHGMAVCWWGCGRAHNQHGACRYQ